MLRTWWSSWEGCSWVLWVSLQRWEACVAAGTKVKLPQDLCENPSILQEMLNPSLWEECLTEEQRQSLSQYLPDFSKDCDAAGECEMSLQLLFQRENQRWVIGGIIVLHLLLHTSTRPDHRAIIYYIVGLFLVQGIIVIYVLGYECKILVSIWPMWCKTIF